MINQGICILNNNYSLVFFNPVSLTMYVHVYLESVYLRGVLLKDPFSFM